MGMLFSALKLIALADFYLTLLQIWTAYQQRAGPPGILDSQHSWDTTSCPEIGQIMSWYQKFFLRKSTGLVTASNR